MGIKDIFSKIKKNYTFGYLLVSIGLFMVVTTANLDMASHLLKWAETFFSPAHAALYTSVAVMIVGSICVYFQQVSLKMETLENSATINGNANSRDLKVNIGFLKILPIEAKLVCIGAIILALAGPFDLAWHTAFGIDGLLSPSHATFRIGEAIAGIGALWGIVSSSGVIKNKPREKNHRTIERNELNNNKSKECGNISYFTTDSKPNTYGIARPKNPHILYPLFIIISVVAIWRTATGFTSMVTLPFSNTINFQWNPDPNLAIMLASFFFPFFTSVMLFCSFRLGFYGVDNRSSDKNSKLDVRHYKFGILTFTALAYMLITLTTSILPNKFIVSTIPWYLLNLIPILAVDILLTFLYRRPNNNDTNNRKVKLISGAVLGLTFMTLYYPYVGLTYSELLQPSEFPRAETLSLFYFRAMGEIFPWLVIPAVASGIFGIMIVSKNIPYITSSKSALPS
jgi:hypothetical protein